MAAVHLVHTLLTQTKKEKKKNICTIFQ